MKQKKLMLLGGIRYLLPVIEAAHKLGVYGVVTAADAKQIAENGLEIVG